LKKTKTVLYVGPKGFPFGSAEVQRQLQISKAILSEEVRVLVINNKGIHPKNIIQKENIGRSGTFEGIDYIYTSGTPLYPPNFFIRNFLKVIGWLNELATILYHAFTGDLACIIICTSRLRRLKYFWFLTRITRTKLIYDYVEYFSSLSDRSMKDPSNKKTFDTVFFNYTDGLIIISFYLEQHVNSLKANRPHVIVPPIIDFEKFDKIKNKPDEPDYFLYCGSVQYADVIQFIIEAYRKSRGESHGVTLILVVSGPAEIISRIKLSIMSDKKIKILSGLPYEDLIGYYKNARALLIPLQDNLQDKARFPFKISEYTAAGRPIITSDSGAVVDYFKDGENALLAKTGDLEDFSAKLNYVIDHPEIAEQIAQKSHALGERFFNYKSYSPVLTDFLLANQKGQDRERKEQP
jgi:glycosyltransferase involved in cell wall biosynthesis